MSKYKIFIPITKIDEERRLVYGIATEELPDKQGEICDYKSSKPFYEKWSSDIEKATDGKSKGNLRVMHGNKVAGTIPQINFNDEAKQIEICGKVIDDDEWKMVLAGGYTGFSQGGSYEKKWKDGEFTRYTSNPCEISLVDNPCLSTATFEVIKSDGTVELRKFQILENNTMAKNTDNEKAKIEVLQGWQASDGTFHVNKAAAIAHNEDLEKAKEKLDEKEKDSKENKKAGDDEEDGETEDDKSEKDKKEKDDNTKTKSVSSEDLKKYAGTEIWDARCALDALSTVVCLLNNEIFDAKFQGENEPGQLADLKIVVDKLKSFIASEIMESEADTTVDVMSMADNGDMKKVGAKISATTKEHLGKMMKSAKDHIGTMEECMKSMGAMGDEDEKEDTKKADLEASLVKANIEKDELQKKLEDKNSSEMQKMVDTISTLQKRIDTLEAQPAVAKGSRIILKDNENHGDEAGKSNPVEELMKRTNMSPEAFAQEYMKLTLKK